MQQLTQKPDNQARRRILAGLGALGLMAPVTATPAFAQLTKSCIKNG